MKRDGRKHGAGQDAGAHVNGDNYEMYEHQVEVCGMEKTQAGMNPVAPSPRQTCERHKTGVN